MNFVERRNALIEVLHIRKHDTISNLAFEFHVSPRTIRRDINILSLTEPIYTQSGRYYGGVYIINKIQPRNKKQLSLDEEKLLLNILSHDSKEEQFKLTNEERSMLFHIMKL